MKFAYASFPLSDYLLIHLCNNNSTELPNAAVSRKVVGKRFSFVFGELNQPEHRKAKIIYVYELGE